MKIVKALKKKETRKGRSFPRTFRIFRGSVSNGGLSAAFAARHR
jgi:hypothetical protein